jgi:hypothetical protein
MSYWEYSPYVSVAQRRAKAARQAARFKKQGRTLSPVVIEGRKIAKNFWGKAWCDNLERYSDSPTGCRAGAPTSTTAR